MGAEPPIIWKPEPDATWRHIAPHPSLVVFLGPRGSGKTAQAYRVLELQRDRAAPYVVGLPRGSIRLLPKWMGVADRIEDVPRGAALLVDEAYLTYGARSSMSRQGRAIGEAVNLSRQREHSLFFVTQLGRALDVDIMGHADVIAIKGVSELGSQFERREIRGLLDKARKAFAQVNGDLRKWTWVYSEKAGFEGLVRSELPSFWKPALSHAYADIASAGPEASAGGGKKVFRVGAQTSRDELAAMARAMRAAGMSYGEIATALGISKSTAWEFVNGSGKP